jgi:hypothetical protein
VGTLRNPDHHGFPTDQLLEIACRWRLPVFERYNVVSTGAIFVIPHKSSRFNDLLDRVIWLLLASNGPLWRVTGTIVRTFSRVIVGATEELWCVRFVVSD